MRPRPTLLLPFLLAACEAPEAARPVPPPVRGTAEETQGPAPSWPEPELPGFRPAGVGPPRTSGGEGGGGAGGSGGGGQGGAGGTGAPGIGLRDVRVPLGGDWASDRIPTTLSGMGGGVALVDLDGDGDLDALVTGELAALAAFRNEGGLRFADATTALGLGEIWNPAALALGDCNGDGDLELLVSRSGTTVLLERGPGGTWSAMEGAGLGDVPQHGLSAELLDLDGDGDLDVFQAIYMPDDSTRTGEVPRIFLNDGTCRFQRKTVTGLESGMGVDFGFFDGDLDGDPDVLVSNDFGMLYGGTRVYENLGDATFRVVPGIDDFYYGMGATVADLDHDADLDIYVTNIGRNPWYRNGGNFALTDRSAELGIGYAWYVDPDDTPRSVPYYDIDSPDPQERRLAIFARDYTGGRPDDEHSFVSTTWSANVVDLDADGWLDLFLTNGRVGAGNVLEGTRQRLALFQQVDGAFHDVSEQVGFTFAGTFKGSTVGDLDGDGLPDLLVFDHLYKNPAPRHRVLQNVSAAGNWVRVDLAGRPPNTWGIGALVQIDLDDHPVLQQRSLRSGVYSASADTMFFGIGEATQVDVTVTWPWNGGVTVVEAVPAGSTVRIEQGEAP